MSRSISKIAALLIVPIVLSATCLLCFVRVMPIYAAPISMGQDQTCSEGQALSQGSVTQTTSFNNPSMFFLDLNSVSKTNHDSGCKQMMNHLSARVHFKDLALNVDQPTSFVLTEMSRLNFDQKYLLTYFNNTISIRDEFLTGTIIKRE